MAGWGLVFGGLLLASAGHCDEVLSWPFDQSAGTSVPDTSAAHANGGTLVNGPAWVTGVVGSNALSLDGVDDYASLATVAGLPAGNQPHTIAAWIKPAALPAKRAWILLLGNPGTGAHHWLFNTNGTTSFGIYNGNTLSPSLPVGQWTHVAMSYDGSNLRAYVNGQLIGSKPTSSINLQGLPLTLGKPGVASEGYFKGQIDGLHLINYALSDQQVASLASGNKRLLDWEYYAGNPVTRADDASGNGNVGTPAGGVSLSPDTWPWAAGQGLGLDGTDDAVSVSKVSGLAAGNVAHSVAAWIKPTALPSRRGWILQLGNAGTGAHHWLFNTNGTTNFGEWSGPTLSPALPLNTWTHVAITYANGTLKSYVNGTLAAATTSAFNLQGAPLTVGKAGVAGESNFKGEIGAVNVFNYELSAADVTALAPPVLNAAVPSHGPVGSQVVLYGNELSPMAANDVVKFNGVTAQVAAASATQLAVTVPAGATTGAISITINGVSANLLQPFYVGATPEIDAMSPTHGPIYTQVTLTGKNFSSIASQNRVTFGTSSPAVIVSASATQLVVKLPSDAQAVVPSVNTAGIDATTYVGRFTIDPFTYDGSQWLDGCQADDPKVQRLLQSEVFLMQAGVIHQRADKSWYVDPMTYTSGSGSAYALDPSSLFYGQRRGAGRSGILIDNSSTVLTAAHVNPFPAQSFKYVMGMSAHKVNGVCVYPDFDNIPDANVFDAASNSADVDTVGGSYPYDDFAVITLSRDTGRPWVRFRGEGASYPGDPAVVIGHPEGLDTKISAAAQLFGTNANGQTLMNGVHLYVGDSGAMVYNLAHDRIETVVSYSGGCASYQPMPSNPALYHTVLACPTTATATNGSLAEHALSSEGFVWYGNETRPSSDVTHVAAVGQSFPDVYHYSVANFSHAYVTAVAAPAIGNDPAAPRMLVSSPDNGFGPVLVDVSFQAGTQCGRFDEAAVVQDYTYQFANTDGSHWNFADRLVHHFEIGLTDFAVAPIEDAVLTQVAPPYAGLGKVYTLSNPRPTPVTLRVDGPAWATFQAGTGSAVSGSTTLTVPAMGSVSLTVALAETAADALPRNVDNVGTVTFTNLDNTCAVTKTATRAIHFTPGKEDRTVIDPLYPEVAGPGNGSYGPAVVQTLTVTDAFSVTSLTIGVGLWNELNFQGAPNSQAFATSKVDLVSPSGTTLTLWDSNGVPTGNYYSQYYYAPEYINVGVLHIDDAIAPAPTGAHLSSFYGQPAKGVWTLKLYSKTPYNALFVNWDMHFAGTPTP